VQLLWACDTSATTGLYLQCTSTVIGRFSAAVILTEINVQTQFIRVLTAKSHIYNNKYQKCHFSCIAIAYECHRAAQLKSQF